MMDGMKMKEPPHNPKMEAAFLACLFGEPGLMNAYRTLVEPNDLYVNKHRVLYGAMRHVWSVRGNLDPVFVMEELTARGNVERAGGQDYVTRIVNAAPSALNHNHYATRLLELARKRSLLMERETKAQARRKESTFENAAKPLKSNVQEGENCSPTTDEHRDEAKGRDGAMTMVTDGIEGSIDQDVEEETAPDNNRKYFVIGGGVLAAFASLCCVGAVATAFLASWGPFEDELMASNKAYCEKAVECGHPHRSVEDCTENRTSQYRELAPDCESKVIAIDDCLAGLTCFEFNNLEKTEPCVPEMAAFMACLSSEELEEFLGWADD